jgi:hypothetical protein
VSAGWGCRLCEGLGRRLTFVIGLELRSITATITLAIGITKKTFEIEHGAVVPV